MGSIAEECSKKQQALLHVSKFYERRAQMPEASGFSVYKPRPSDVIISTYPKAGTTLLQNMVYQIVVATGGGPPFDSDGTNFSDIGEVVPWVDFGPEFGVLECSTNPRMFKTHAMVEKFDLKTARYIYCIRNPLEYPGSMLDFLFDALSETEVTDMEVRKHIFDEYVRGGLLGKRFEAERAEGGPDRTWFGHVKAWTEGGRKNVLVLFYEDVVRDLRSTALSISQFLDVKLTEKKLLTVLHRCSRKEMVGNPKFDCHVEARAFGFDAPKVQRAKAPGREGFKKMKIEEESMRAFEIRMRETFHCNTYEEFVKKLKERLRES